MHDQLDNLTSAQSQAVTHIEGPLLILAGPGSGKTRVITHRVAHMLAQGIPARRILALTFTNKAADEMRQRVERLVPAESVWMGTFHRFGAMLLREYASLVGLEPNFSIYDTDASARVARRAMEEAGIDSASFTPSRIVNGISQAKQKLITPDIYSEIPGNAIGELIGRIYPIYQRLLLESNAVDFDDLLVHLACLLRNNPELRTDLDDRFQYVLVDEYQDTNLAQYAIVRGLSVDARNLAATGDPDQSIYGWRGADINNILNFEKDYPDVKIVRLEQNYRSTPEILAVADQLIANNLDRKPKNLFTESEPGHPVALVTYDTHRQESGQIADAIEEAVRAGRRTYHDFAIFYRVNALSRSFEIALSDRDIPYQIAGSVEFYRRKEIQDVIGYLTLLNNPLDNDAFGRVVNTPPRGIGRRTIQAIAEYAAREQTCMLDAARMLEHEVDLLKKRAQASVARFVSLYDSLVQLVEQPVEEILGHVIHQAGFADRYKASEEEDDLRRWDNICELLSAAREFDERTPGPGALESFLEQSALVSDTDDWEEKAESVTLMTLHAAKGLEFPVVFIPAVEQGILPHERSRDDPASMEEERRLLFVGITRAREELQISMAGQREFRGTRRLCIPSPFLQELPRELMHCTGSTGISDAEDFYPNWVTEDSSGQSVGDEYSQVPQAGYEDYSQAGHDEPVYDPDAPGSFSPDLFQIDMLVTHPSYGAGAIVAMGSSGRHRTATVRFIASGEEKKFLIAKSPLRPLRAE